MSSRRQTLGGLSASQINSRQSIGAGRVATGEGRKSLGASVSAGQSFFSGGGRPSIGGRPSGGSVAGAPTSQRNSLQRRASMYGSGPAVRQDPRPLSDKAFQNACMHKVMSYLTSHGYDRALSPKLITTNKEFAFVVQFLFAKIDPHIKFTGKVEEEVPVLFKRLRYPFNISKSALQARLLLELCGPYLRPAVVELPRGPSLLRKLNLSCELTPPTPSPVAPPPARNRAGRRQPAHLAVPACRPVLAC